MQMYYLIVLHIRSSKWVSLTGLRSEIGRALWPLECRRDKLSPCICSGSRGYSHTWARGSLLLPGLVLALL